MNLPRFFQNFGFTKPRALRYVANALQLVKRHFTVSGKPLLAAFLIGLVLVLNVMAACPALHELIHKDADKAEHQCAVTLFAHGHVDAATANVVVVSASDLIVAILPAKISRSSTTVKNLPAGRAPPVFSAVS